MASIYETAYPRIKKQLTEYELTELYTPTRKELQWVGQKRMNRVNQLACLVLLKTFQQLGYFMPLNKIPKRIVNRVAYKSDLSAYISKLPKLGYAYIFCQK